MDLRDAFAMAEYLLQVHELPDWQVEYDAAKRRAGVCRFNERTIGLSAPLTAIHSELEVRDTILHEIAHARVGPRHGHDEVWRAEALRLGSSGERCVSADSPALTTPWLGVCPAGHTVGRHRRPERVMACGECAPRFSLEHVLTWTRHGRPAQMHPNYEAELEAIRAGGARRLVPIGRQVIITGDCEWQGHGGVVVKHGRTSYHLRLPDLSLLRVPFAWASER